MKWIQWLFDNAWAVVIIGGVLAQMLQAIAKKKGGGDDASAGEPPRKEYEFEDPELAERTRRIREEIQRKIAQRRRGGGGYETAEPPASDEMETEAPPVIREVVVTAPDPVPAPAVRATSRLETQRQAEILEEQAALMERLREVELMKTAAAKRTEFEQATADHSTARRAATRSTVLDDLRSPDALRRAFILREVLGPPVALRKRQG